ncbi:type II toxin-antitoxin system mRNA interferase toxin, RelE/StbE family (plasmid) [Lactobacillus sp. ESL0731]|uniref:type II toxin-antitoxin system mRNA interferase toxin, RelE/StbE family n=1 Tax=unclassified Lactobacillus TaxID=2620435 RepID=UPI0023F73957|nr:MULTISPECIES: type II toxin-antitoxin system mRNA interferase toxin, RelE/StbE family [unclassified Lactobacillus]WEV52114.1 type II toxin-antitoxin system mRNA interferase toxin, RelE/StbE family [Lactobacillus sp. ESL0700]WEV63253.1 type II toxin-antitoxin system mRNA interferase toxin, RelE/StbE family [Lactobacillus sp. ESL0731]
MAYRIKLSARTVKVLKKIKDRQLKQKIVDKIYDEIAVDPYIGSAKKGDLAGIYAIGFNHAKASYRIAYKIEQDEVVVIILLVGTHENFYQKLKKLI